MWREIGDYLLKLSLLILGAMVVYPLAQKQFDAEVGLTGFLVYLAFVGLGLFALNKYYQQKEEEKEDA